MFASHIYDAIVHLILSECSVNDVFKWLLFQVMSDTAKYRQCMQRLQHVSLLTGAADQTYLHMVGVQSSSTFQRARHSANNELLAYTHLMIDWYARGTQLCGVHNRMCGVQYRMRNTALHYLHLPLADMDY